MTGPTILIQAIVLFTAAYVMLAVAAALLLYRRRPAPALPEDPPFVSVIVAARNEAERLPACLAALRAQDYPSTRIEFIVADDGSVDETALVADRIAEEDPRVRLVRVPQEGPLAGKARAVHHAIDAARGDFLLLTDADCTPPPTWARSLAARLSAPNAGIVCGVTVVRQHNLVERIQALDWMLLLATAAAASRAGWPVTAMGNNMGLRRAAYVDVGGYEALPFSVTEDYALFRAVHRTGRWEVRLEAEPELAVRTEPLAGLREAFRQRRRWARGGLRAGVGVYLLYGVIFGCHVALLAGLILAPAVVWPLLLVKVLADAGVIAAGMRATGQAGLYGSLLPFEAYLFAYVAAMPLALLIRPRTTWKGRTF